MLLSFFFSFILCLLSVPIVKYLANKKGWLAYPTKDRWHKKPTALMGGIAIYIGISIPLLFKTNFLSILPVLTGNGNITIKLHITAILWIGITFMFLLGIIDDFLRLKPHTKLIAQILSASMVSILGLRLHWFNSLTLDTIITIVWIIGITNALNLIDNMDGLCAGIGSIASFFLYIIFKDNYPEIASIAIMLSASLLAFLVYNFNPASIFMGDSGSLVIGYLLSILTLMYPNQKQLTNPISIYAIPILILLVPIFDTTLVTLIRLLSGRKASVGGKDHTSHRLVLMGLSEIRSVVFLYGIEIISGISAIFVSKNDTLTSPVVIVPIMISIFLMGIYLAQIRVYPEKEFSVLRDKPYTPILIELTYKKQIMMVLLDFCLIAFSYYLSYRLRFDRNEFALYFKVFLQSLPLVIASKLFAFFAAGIYRGIWRFLSINDVFVYFKGSILATILSISIVTFLYRFEEFSKGIFIIDFILTILLLLGTRWSFKLFEETIKRRTLEGEKIFIYGAGRGGEILLREILNNKNLRIKPVGFIDDDGLKSGKSLFGYQILGTFDSIESLYKKFDISGLIVSFKSINEQKLYEIKSFCRSNDLFLKTFSIILKDMDL